MWIIFLLLIASLILFFLKKKKVKAIKSNNFNPPKKSLRNGSYIIEAYCRNKDHKLFFITLNYDSWEEACQMRNQIVKKQTIEVNYENKIHEYTVIMTKICQVGLNGR